MQLILEGRLSGPWLTELEQAWQRVKQSGKNSIVIDLTGVTFIEVGGRKLLRRLWREGADLIAAGCCNRSIVEGIKGSSPSGLSNSCDEK